MNKYFTLILLLVNFFAFSQIGINTTSPTSDLDVNGTMRVRSLTSGTMVADGLGNLKTVPLSVTAAGIVQPNGTATQISGATVARTSKGNYRVTFSTPLSSSNYVIMLSVKDCGGNCDGNNSYDDPGVSYYNRTAASFYVNVGDSDNGNAAKIDVDLEFSFLVYSF